MMRNLATFLIFLVPTIALADNHSNDGLMLPKRQADTVMEVTSVSLGEEISSIDAIGDMGVYGKVYVTFYLEANGKVHPWSRSWRDHRWHHSRNFLWVLGPR